MSLAVRKNLAENPPCPLSQCMAIIGGAWTVNIIWFLSEQPRRFNELRVDIPAISAKVLSARLKELVANGIIVRHVKETSPPSVEYTLTEIGTQLLPVINEIIVVGKKLQQRSSND
jgi:DNA-binding HxlR family transcriptional regulator